MPPSKNTPAKTSQTSAAPALAAYSLNQPEQLGNLAELLQAHIQQHKLYTDIQGKKHVNVEGWQFAGAMLGLVPVVEKVEDTSTHEQRTFKGYQGKPDTTIAHIEFRATVGLLDLRTKETVGRGIASCCNFESKKRSFDPYAVESMAQTRATGKAFRLLLAWVMQAGGYATTPAEEMPDGEPETYAQVVETPAPAAAPKKVLFTLDEGIKQVLAIESGEKLKEVWGGSNLAQHKGEPVFDLVLACTKLRWAAPEYQSPEQAAKEVASRAQRDLAHKLLASHLNDGYRLEALHLLGDAGMPWVVCTQVVDKAMANTKQKPAPQPQRPVEITATTTRPTHDEQGQAIAYATPAQKSDIIDLLNHPAVTRQEKAKMLEGINRLTEQRAAESIAKLTKAIEDRGGIATVAA